MDEIPRGKLYMTFKELECVVMELRNEKLQREAVEKYKKERFAFWKDIALVSCAVVGGILGVVGFIRTL